MTVTNNQPTDAATAPTVNVVIDGVGIDVPKGTLVIRAAELMGVEIPRFCDHPELDPVAACRACLVDIDGVPKPQPACAQVATDGMQVHTGQTSEVAAAAQTGVMEFLLINHPLDCPVCDKGGECPLQNQAMQVGRPDTRFDLKKRTFPKPVNVSAQILLDRERCISCTRCTRFAEQVAGDPSLRMIERGSKQQVGTAPDEPFESYFSGNTVQICPVGALTSAAYRFRARPFDLVSVPTVCEHCASGCALRTDSRRGKVMRRLAWEDPEVNGEWNCDKGRFAFTYASLGRLPGPLVRGADGELHAASWPEAIHAAAEGIARGKADARSHAAVLTGGRLTVEDAYAYARFARVVLDTDSIDFRARATSAEETAFLRALVAGTSMRTTYTALEDAPAVLLVAFEPEDESPAVFLRLRKAARKGRTRIWSLGSVGTRGLAKMKGERIDARPGQEAAAIEALDASVREALRQPGAVILVGERIASSAGGPSALARLAQETGAALSWIPRRAGERGALDAGALAGLLPSGRPLTDAAARTQVERIWNVALPTEGKSGDALLEAARDGWVSTLVVAGVDPADYADPELALAAIDGAGFVISLEQRHTAVTERADVVLPIAAITEKAGTFINWEGRPRPFPQVFREALTMPDAIVLAMVADAMDVELGPSDVNGIRRELGQLGAWYGDRPAAPTAGADSTPSAAAGSALLQSWHALIDAGTLQEGEPFLAATARAVVATMSAATAASLGNPPSVTISGPRGHITLPVQIGDVSDGVVAVPTRSIGSSIRTDLGTGPGETVSISAGGAA